MTEESREAFGVLGAGRRFQSRLKRSTVTIDRTHSRSVSMHSESARSIWPCIVDALVRVCGRIRVTPSMYSLESINALDECVGALQ